MTRTVLMHHRIAYWCHWRPLVGPTHSQILRLQEEDAPDPTETVFAPGRFTTCHLRRLDRSRASIGPRAATTAAMLIALRTATSECNPIFAYAALEIGFTAVVCWPYQRRQPNAEVVYDGRSYSIPPEVGGFVLPLQKNQGDSNMHKDKPLP